MQIRKTWPPKLGCHGYLNFEVLRLDAFKIFSDKFKKNMLKLVVIAWTDFEVIIQVKV